MRHPRISVLSAGLLIAGGVAFAAFGVRALLIERDNSQRKALERARHNLVKAAQDAQRLALRPKGPPDAAWRLEMATTEGVGRMPTPDDQTVLGSARAAERAGEAGLRTAHQQWSRLAREGGRLWLRQAAALRAGELGLRLGLEEETVPLFEQAAEAIPLLTWDGVRVRVAALRRLAELGLRRESSAETARFLDEVQDGRRLIQGRVIGPDAMVLALASDVRAGRLPAPDATVAERLRAADARVRLGRQVAAALPRGGAGLVAGRVGWRHEGDLQLRGVSSLVEPLPGAFEAQVLAKIEPPDAALGRYMIRVAPPLDGVVLRLRAAPPDEVGPGPLIALIAGLGIYSLGAVLAIGGMRRRRRAAQMQSDFVAAVSHELKTPIASVRAMAELLADSGGGGQRTREYAARIESEMRRLGTTVRNVLDASQVERQGVLPVAVALADPAQVLVGLAETIRPELERRGFEFVCEAEPPAGPIPLDADALRGVLVNLLDNAAKFSLDRKEIRLEGRPTEGGGYGIAVLDRGPGIDPRQQERLFGRFYRGDEARRGAVPGVGLGLHVARSVIDAHGGRLWAERRDGGGSAFRIELRGQQV